MQWQRMVTRSINGIKKISVNKVCKLEVLWSHLFLMSKLSKQNYENLLGPLRALEQILQLLWPPSQHTVECPQRFWVVGFQIVLWLNICASRTEVWQVLSFQKMFSLSPLITFILQCGTFSGDHKMIVNSHPHLKGSWLTFEASAQKPILLERLISMLNSLAWEDATEMVKG